MYRSFSFLAFAEAESDLRPPFIRGDHPTFFSSFGLQNEDFGVSFAHSRSWARSCCSFPNWKSSDAHKHIAVSSPGHPKLLSRENLSISQIEGLGLSSSLLPLASDIKETASP
jgi:hypothetical protein